MREVRLALRALSKAPVFTTVAVFSLALGSGANTAMFGLVDQILLRLLPVQNPRELVQLTDGGRFGSNSGDGTGTFSHPLYLALRDQNTMFSGLTGQMIQSWRPLVPRPTPASPQRVRARSAKASTAFGARAPATVNGDDDFESNQLPARDDGHWRPERPALHRGDRDPRHRARFRQRERNNAEPAHRAFHAP